VGANSQVMSYVMKLIAIKQYVILNIFALCCAQFIYAGVDNPQAYRTYIQRHKDIAIKEMYYSGIPASITLAQGLMESLYGSSRLAREANNHFGIKCKMEWTGPGIAISDDAPDECFRVYQSVEHSYRDHSNFIKYNRLKIYDHLFAYSHTDYKAWARGLKKAGYATLHNYDVQLIALIKEFQLYNYDLASWPDTQENLEDYTYRLNADFSASFTDVLPAKLNGTDVKKPRPIPHLTYAGHPDFKAEKHYLKTARKESITVSSGGVPIHIITSGDTMEALAKMYKINLEELYLRNNLIYGSQPAQGEKIYLHTQSQIAPKLNELAK
jgi:LysM repeat protein